MNDTELLRRYVQEGSQEAFAELVKLRIGLVYSAALRQTGGNAMQAQDVTQEVFTDLARKAASLCRHRALIGWLYTSTRFAAGKMARTERRRQAREQEAYSMQQDLAPTFPEIPADRLRPLLDEAMHNLPETDRHALLLRFFDDCSMAELGRTLGLSESAAQKRVERALAKLHDRLARRGLSSTAAAIGAALSQAAAATVVPTGLAATVTHGALTAAATTATGIGLLSTLSALLIYTVGATGFIAAMAVGTVIYEKQHPAPAPTAPVATSTSTVDGAALPYVQLVDHAQDAPDESTAVAPGNPLPADLPPLNPHSALQPVAITSTPPAQPPSSPAPLGITLIAPGDSANAPTGATNSMPLIRRSSTNSRLRRCRFGPPIPRRCVLKVSRGRFSSIFLWIPRDACTTPSPFIRAGTNSSRPPSMPSLNGGFSPAAAAVAMSPPTCRRPSYSP